MSVLVYAESWEGSFRKSTFEAVSYACETAKLLNTNVVAISFGDESDDELEKLSIYGANKVLSAKGINKGDSESASKIISNNATDANVIIFASTYTSTMIAPRLAAKLKSGIATNVISIASSFNPIQIKRKDLYADRINGQFNKSQSQYVNLQQRLRSVVENETYLTSVLDNSVEDFKDAINGQEIASGKVSLAEADIIVSAGRGLKGPENWGMIEELADLLKAATACSKPVSDIGWRPHHEHVGQTGVAIRPNLYIAIGISGAIQHLAGVNSSKVMVAINSDPEAPFFKAADYGIVGDAFTVVPKLIEEIKKIK